MSAICCAWKRRGVSAWWESELVLPAATWEGTPGQANCVLLFASQFHLGQKLVCYKCWPERVQTHLWVDSLWADRAGKAPSSIP